MFFDDPSEGNGKSEGLRSWERPYFQPGGGDAFLFYALFGAFRMTLDVSSGAYRTRGLPSSMEMSRLTRDRHGDYLEGFTEGYLGRFLERDQPVLAEAVRAAPECLVLRGEFRDPSDLDYLRDAVGLITSFLDHGGVCVLDAQIFTWWSPPAWRERIFAADGPAPHHHTIILVSPEEDPAGTHWFHTRGLRKFGRPDLSLRAVPQPYHQAVADLFHHLIERQALGDVIPDGHEIHMAGLPAGMTCQPGGDLEDPEFNNVHVEIRWP